MSDDANSANPHSDKAAIRLHLAFGLQFHQLYSHTGLAELDAQFLTWLGARDSQLAARLIAARLQPALLAESAHTALLLDIAAHLDSFLVLLFGMEAAYEKFQLELVRTQQVLETKKKFVQRKALRSLSAQDANAFDPAQVQSSFRQELDKLELTETDEELEVSQAIALWQAQDNQQALETARKYCAWAALTDAGRTRHAGQSLFHQAQGVDPSALMRHSRSAAGPGEATLHFVPNTALRQREGFALTDAGKGSRFAQDQSLYCLWCHRDGRDSCRKGRLEASPAPAANGCPLEERISEALFLRSQHKPLGALAMMCLDNPLLAATGHRICNDCVKACVFQQQDGVDIPQAETQTLRDALALPWGVELYSLLTRWNPLNLGHARPYPPTGKRVLIAGQGPAGFTLAHYLLNLGHEVHAIDGLRITPWRIPFTPIHAFAELSETLDAREQAGFGGVAEYGITVRWDKNFLTLVRLLLERRSGYRLSSSVRLGSNLSCLQAFDMGVDHIALAVGAGKPGVLNTAHSLAKGVRTASDFLMALQLTGAARPDSLTNLQIQMPIVVIGGGLSAVDAATEALAYYPVQVTNFAEHWQAIRPEHRPVWSDEESAIANTFLEHAEAIKRERQRAVEEARPARIHDLLQEWGGCRIVYRRTLQASPAYRLNPEELESALREGVLFLEELEPQEMVVDDTGHVSAVQFRDRAGNTQLLAARCVLQALGTVPNTQIADDEANLFRHDGLYLQAIDENGVPTKLALSAPKAPDMQFVSVRMANGPHAGKSISMFGDLHPSFAGNVVKAMASAKRGAPQVHKELLNLPAVVGSASTPLQLQSRLVAVTTLAPGIVELIVHSPAAARNARPGQFFRLQEVSGPMEGIALTGADVDVDAGLISLIVLEMGGSTDLCARLVPGQEIALMGPTGAPTDLPRQQTVLLAGGGLGNAVLFSIGRALRARQCKVIYFAGYKRAQDRFKQHAIEEASDIVIWCSESNEPIVPNPSRPQDRYFHGNIVQAMQAYPVLCPTGPTLESVQWMLAIGSDRMMSAIAKARETKGVLHASLGACSKALASINSPMQCMMKAVCGQCIQRQVDPITGVSRIVFSCQQQDQDMANVDWACLHDRLSQNSTLEKLTRARLAGARN